MYLRIERLHLREGSEAELGQFFREEALPILGRTPGCRFAALFAPWQATEHLALTLWSGDDRARAFERSAIYQFYLGRVGPLLDQALDALETIDPDSQATVDPNETFSALAARLPIAAFRIDDASAFAAFTAEVPARFVRVTDVRLDPLRVEEFRSAWQQSIAPEIAQQPGAAGVLLAERVGDPSDLRSISIWDREESAVRYELSGTSKRVTEGVAPLLSPLYDWRLTPPEGTPLGRRELEVRSYTLVAASPLAAGA